MLWVKGRDTQCNIKLYIWVKQTFKMLSVSRNFVAWPIIPIHLEAVSCVAGLKQNTCLLHTTLLTKCMALHMQVLSVKLSEVTRQRQTQLSLRVCIVTAMCVP